MRFSATSVGLSIDLCVSVYIMIISSLVRIALLFFQLILIVNCSKVYNIARSLISKRQFKLGSKYAIGSYNHSLLRRSVKAKVPKALLKALHNLSLSP